VSEKANLQSIEASNPSKNYREATCLVLETVRVECGYHHTQTTFLFFTPLSAPILLLLFAPYKTQLRKEIKSSEKKKGNI
jgi:hypothetical protein